jgi:hypothetical protein
MSRKPLPVEGPTEAEMERVTRIEPVAIQEEYAAVPGDLHRWCRILADADHALGVSEQDIEDCENDERVRLLAEAEKAEEKPPSEDRLKAKVRAAAPYKTACRKALDARRTKAYAFAVVEGIRAKKEMLISLGADLRSEQERELLIRDRSR